ncbi:PAS domain-containing hybrid sensor histidine kinase/response regulator [Desulfogranum japonicum]|uniref:PAS domain-containing hybrid sensor histidine kinase/response regulator n=1 Tax=Desulfogranum japonicum TaxID=231447 RepID=UPI000410828C|nr:PAS domain-containing hybrid sensor histidine kinase/response regulator [Desulfogranum japonicum]
MNTVSLFSIGIILGGAVVMVYSLTYSIKSYRIFNEFTRDELTTLNRFKNVHNVLMVFFLLGYLSVAWAIYEQIDFVSDLFVSLIFFFGAIFVLLGLRLQNAMNNMLRDRYYIAREAADALVNEQQELLTTNTLLAAEVKDREQAEILASEREKNLQQILGNLPIGVLIVDGESLRIKEINSMAEVMIGASKGDIVHCPCQKFICGSSRETCPMLLEPGKQRHQGEHVLMRGDGTELPILKTVSRIELEGRPHFLEAFLDVSEKKRLEEQLLRSQSMEAIGILAGGVAHDLNNILAGLLSYPELILMKVDESDPLRKPLETIKRSGEKAAVIVQDLLTLARQNVASKETLNLRVIVEEFLESPEFERLHASYPDVKLTTLYEKNLKLIEGAPVHLSKVVMNLVSNAVEAVSGTGLVQVTIENAYVDTPIAGYESFVEGEYVVLSIQDDGSGISPEDITRIFEPFYSQKSLGHSGSGLGMAIVWNTVKSHNGYIQVESTLGTGTLFKVYFPATRRQLRQIEKHKQADYSKGHGERVLVVDDIEEQREIAGSMLEYLNYIPEIAASGEAAIDILQRRQFDLVILDMIMEPGMDGLETFTKIMKIDQKQKVIIASGYTDPDRLDALEEQGVENYIKKPYTLNTLSEKVFLALNT